MLVMYLTLKLRLFIIEALLQDYKMLDFIIMFDKKFTVLHGIEAL